MLISVPPITASAESEVRTGVEWLAGVAKSVTGSGGLVASCDDDC